MSKILSNRICYVIGSLAVGGAENHLLQVLPGLKSMGWDVSLIVLSENVPLLEKILQYKIPVTVYRLPSIFLSLPAPLRKISRLFYNFTRLVWDFRKKSFSAVHFFLPEAYIMGMFALMCSCNKALRLMSRRSTNDYRNRRPLLWKIEKKLHAKVDFVLGNSQKVYDQLVQEGIPQSKLALIYNGIDLEKFDQIDSSTYAIAKKIPEKAIILTMVANLMPYKGHKDLLEALAIVKDKSSIPWYLFVLGRDQGILNALQEEAYQKGFSNQISWEGQSPFVPQILKQSHVGILCSHEEGFSNAVLEGMAASLPMIVTDVGGNKEAVIEQECGLVIPPKRADLLADAILFMLENEKARKSMGKNSRKRVQENFSQEACLNHYDKFYQTLGLIR